jgi:hypothetical protein
VNVIECEGKIKRDVEGSGRGLIQDAVHVRFPWGSRKTTKNLNDVS